MIPLLVLDTETGGFSPSNDALLSIALIKADLYPHPGSFLNVFLLPEPNKRISRQAANVNGYSPALWKKNKAVPLSVGMSAIKHWLGNDKHIPVAHNSQFDERFMLEAEKETNCYLPFTKTWLCTKQLFRWWRFITKNPGRCKLDTLCSLTGYQKRKDYHDALDDTKACLVGYRWLVAHLETSL